MSESSKPNPSTLLGRFEFSNAELTGRLQSQGTKGGEVAHRVGCCAHDIISFAFVFLDMHLAAQMQLTAEAEQVAADFLGDEQSRAAALIRRHEAFKRKIEGPSEERDEATRRLAVGYKAFLYFLRAYQDAVAAALRIADDQFAGGRTSMREVLKRPNNAAIVVFEALPEYKDWFAKWRSARNNVKNGAAFSLAGPQWDPGVAFQISSVDEMGGHLSTNLKHSVHISDVVKAIEMCTALCEAVTSELPATGTQSSEVIR